jgi:iron complex outermembrane receptor protein
MSNVYRELNKLFIWGGLLVTLSLGPILVTQAQQLEEIVVTAQRREQSLQDVPVSLQTFSGDSMADKGFDTLNELTMYAPGLVIKSSSEEQGLILRGAGTQSKNLGIEQGVPTFIDGIHMGRGSQVLNSYMDIDRLEVLKGPQPVFFGQNAAAGALNVTTRKPGDEWEGYISGDYGRFGKSVVEGAVGGPITDTFGVRVAAKYYRLEGFLRDWWTGEAFPQREYMTGRITSVWRPTENFEASFKVELADNDLGPRAQPLVFDKFNSLADAKLIHGEGSPITGLLSANIGPVNQGVGEFTRTGIKYGPTFISPDAESDAREAVGLPRLTEASSSASGFLFGFGMCQKAGGLQVFETGGLQPTRPDDFESCDRTDKSGSKPWHAIMDLTYNLDNGIELTSKTGYSNQEFWNVPYNSGGGAFASNARSRGEFFSQWSQEFRVTSPTGGQIEWMGGLYWQDNNLAAWSDAFVASPRLPIRSTRTEEDSKWISGFATVTFNFLDNRASLDVGGRYTDIQKDAFGKNRIGEWYVWDPVNEVPFRLPFGMDLTQKGTTGTARAAAGAALVAANPWLPNAEVIGRSRITGNCDTLLAATDPAGNISSSRCVSIVSSIDDSSFDPQVVLRYRPTDDISLYAKYATSFKSGAFDMGVSTVTRFEEDFAFGPETYETYELGARGSFMDGRMTAEITGFFTDIKGVQVSYIDPILERNITRNIAAQESKGIEFSGQFAATQRMTLSSYFSLLDATVVEFENASCVEDEVLAGICIDGVADRSGAEARNSPDWQYTGNLAYELPTIFDGYVSKFDATVTGTDGYTTDRSFSDVVSFPKAWDVNLSYQFGDIDDNWSILVYGRNLIGNSQIYNADLDIRGEGTLGSSAQSSLSSFASYGARVKFNFN